MEYGRFAPGLPSRARADILSAIGSPKRSPGTLRARIDGAIFRVAADAPRCPSSMKYTKCASHPLKRRYSRHAGTRSMWQCAAVAPARRAKADFRLALDARSIRRMTARESPPARSGRSPTADAGFCTSTDVLESSHRFGRNEIHRHQSPVARCRAPLKIECFFNRPFLRTFGQSSQAKRVRKYPTNNL